MIIILDASTLINLANGGVLNVVLSLPGVRFLVSSVVRGESKSVVSAVDAVIADGILGLVDDDLISIRTFRAAKERLGLGAGETECILAAEQMGCVLACDDLAARSAAKKALGAGQVRGSIGLLRMAVEANMLNREAAYLAYQLMRNRGGYLPELSPVDF
ncbi:hypothetical protein CFB52_026945 [Burkholderia sp. AU18528]|nr:hypothetical protein WJ61_13650 [Burkholderia ubonensis]KWH65512.1 hypothetical protein WT63_07840 [Burkholderia anthina]PHP85770.1 hypothetical protein CFB52_026945 [Burkholderia sp. AU18528]KWD50831.1 hypothetical protein WL67_18915 [Burkholderia ubonensis]KWD60158.1 hypothetical protein WL66_06665 [Burkholderia ubonensis]